MDFPRNKTGIQQGLEDLFNLMASHGLQGNYDSLRTTSAPLLAANSLDDVTVDQLDQLIQATAAAHLQLMIDVYEAYESVKSDDPDIAAQQARDYSVLRHSLNNRLSVIGLGGGVMKMYKTPRPNP